jgi:hypothetical protein
VRAAAHVEARALRAYGEREAEVAQHGAACRIVVHHILQLDVAVSYLELVAVVQGTRELQRHRRRLRLR